ncbi:MAG: GNAT family N-acetyltransferase [Siculibacillus sp.]|nr:GNAT family N-acetyltransferase [Siculibacillus sp.]
MSATDASPDEDEVANLDRGVSSRGPRDHGVEVREMTLVEAVPLRAAWNDLLARAVEPDVMHGPDFLIPALETFAPDARLLVAHRGEGVARRLVGVMALWVPRLGFGLAGRLPAVFSNEYAPLGTPLVDADRAEEIVSSLLSVIARRDGGVVFPHLPLDGAFAAVLGRVAATLGHRVSVVESHVRAALRGGADGDAFLHDHIRRKRRKEWRRQWRRLTETGPVRATVVRGPEVRAAFADFLVLEASGWKGRRRTALVQHAEVARFAERVVDLLAESGRVVVDRIDRAGQPLAMLVCFGAEGHWVSWKTAYDEAFAAFSPGAQVLLRATTRLLDEGELVEVDSLAVEDHPLMNHMWPDRRRIGTVVVGFPAPRRPQLRVRLLTTEIGIHLAARRLARRFRAMLSG